MYLNKRVFLLVILAVVVAMPSFGQRFTKKEQALREARSINYFYGNSFTLSAGYVHSWLTKDVFDDSAYGIEGAIRNTRDSYAFSFAWDYCKKKTYGLQFAVSYAQFGGEKLYYYDSGLGYGPQLRSDKTEQIHLNEVIASAKYRYFIPVTYKSRVSFDAGIFAGYIVGSYDDAKKWDFGPMIGIGYDWKHLSMGVDYVPGVWNRVIDDSSTRIGSVSFKVGVHFWK